MQRIAQCWRNPAADHVDARTHACPALQAATVLYEFRLINMKYADGTIPISVQRRSSRSTTYPADSLKLLHLAPIQVKRITVCHINTLPVCAPGPAPMRQARTLSPQTPRDHVGRVPAARPRLRRPPQPATEQSKRRRKSRAHLDRRHICNTIASFVHQLNCKACN
jgi:hypothetical protein